MQQLIDPEYMAFPFRINGKGVKTCKRKEHVREQIEQVLFTDPRERVFRPNFGAGVRTMIFEPNNSPLWRAAEQRVLTSLAEALQGEVDPKTLEVQVSGEEERLVLFISYRLATINEIERHAINISGGVHG